MLKSFRGYSSFLKKEEKYIQKTAEKNKEFKDKYKYNFEEIEKFYQDFNEKIEHLSKEQILNIIHQKPIGLVAKGCREENDTIIIDTGLTKEDLDNYKELDETTFKKFIKSILRQDDYKFRYIAERLYNV